MELLPCPLCKNKRLNRFSRYLYEKNGNKIEIKKIMCLECNLEAPEEVWNKRK